MAAASGRKSEPYLEAIAAFGQHYAGSAPDFLEVNISLGPTGELRYPAYNGNDCTGYPDRGNFQAYSRIARQGFRSGRWLASGIVGRRVPLGDHAFNAR